MEKDISGGFHLYKVGIDAPSSRYIILKGMVNEAIDEDWKVISFLLMSSLWHVGIKV